MRFTPGTPRPPNAGRKRGSRNKRTLAAAEKLDALRHLVEVIENKDGTITPDLKLRAAIALAGFQHPRPAPVQTEMFLTPVDYTAPASPEEARQTVLSLGQRLARGEVSLQAHDSLVAGLKAYLGDAAMALEQQVAELEDLVRYGPPREDEREPQATN
jgi:hypothetical protein